jgi:hypothetical protein
MVIFVHNNPGDMDSRYGIVDKSDLLIAVDRIEVFLQSVFQAQKNGPRIESQNV